MVLFAEVLVIFAKDSYGIATVAIGKFATRENYTGNHEGMLGVLKKYFTTIF